MIYIKNYEYYYIENLSEYKDSLLFDSEEDIAGLKAYDYDDNCIDIWLTVSGEKKVYLIDKNGNKISETCEYAADYPYELREAIRNGKQGVDYECDNNSRFTYIYHIYDGDCKEKYLEAEPYEGELSEMTPQKLKKQMLEYAEYLFRQAYDKGYIKEPELPIKVLARVSAEKAEKLDGGEVLRIDNFPEKGYHIEIEKSCETPELVSIDLYADEPFEAEKFIKNGRCCRLIAKSCPINVNSLETAMHSINDGTFVDLIKDSRKIGEVIENDKFINNNT